MSRRTSDLLDLIQRLYAAPGGDAGWQAFLDELCRRLNGSSAHFISINSHRHASVAMTIRTDPAALDAYRRHWYAFDPWGRSPSLQNVTPGTIAIGDDLITHSQLKRTEYYAGFARPNDMVRCIVGMIETGPQMLSVISINGTERRGPFGTDDAALLDALMPHLQRTLQLHRRITTAEAASEDFSSVIDRATHAVFLIDAAGTVMYMNREAERVVATRDGLCVEDGELLAARAADTTRLRSLLADAAATSKGEGIGSGGALALGRPSGRRPLMVLVTALSFRRQMFLGFEPAVAMVTVTDPERVAVPDEEILGVFLGLTPAEAKLTRLLAQGVTLDEAAIRLGLQRETVRTRLKAILEKTSTHRQADLIRLALSAPPVL
ncbi:MAG TPA: helix-turn-helix transcriptional regulator [Vicinamibacterales bacterium]|nr:helix-turn-helix transcriptional regulator [Vicinamibacterales bacterium]